ncbi:sterile alpha motif domain-containing protein 9-like [Cheilinus undulatus]|uniref:sterile alpha motif domain-containing protein 9-like n=1 Tax=Cheilinus undulatus TaxID=241271 RepID=UPI001BD667DC|nr:sterile alpha motif domain-containing protein 9-like [Cheilinus undulatus]XP_041641408.1 sterile alpha motif domain-containing protein 9-like [Cheilinus undulatus]
MEAKEKRRTTSSSCLSVKSDASKEEPIYFSQEERSPPCAEAAEMDPNYGKRLDAPTDLSVKSYRSKSPPLTFKPENIDNRNVIPVAVQSPILRPQAQRVHDLTLPPQMETWTKEQVKDWLIVGLRVEQKIAQKLFDQECSGACLASFEKQDLVELGVPLAPALQITRQVEKFKRQSETSTITSTLPKSFSEPQDHERWKSARIQEVSENLDESVETETVSSDSGIQSQSSSLLMLQEARSKIQSLIGQTQTDEAQLLPEVSDSSNVLPQKAPICQIRSFDKSSSSISYIENGIFPPVAGPSNLLDPVHEYQLLPEASEASEREVLYEFTKEIFSFAAGCMNSRTNGTIHFGVRNQPEQGDGQVVGHKITSFIKYTEAFNTHLSEYFEEKHVNTARMCIRPPKFIQVRCQDGTSSDKWVIEVDVVPTHSLIQESIFYTRLSIASAEKKQEIKTECLFIRDGPRSINVLSDSNPRRVQEEMKSLTEKVQCWASARKTVEEKDEKPLSQGNQGQRLKQLITQGKEAFETSIQVILVTDKCPPDQLEHLDFLKEMKLFVVLEFDPESDVNGTCSFYRRDHVGNLHYPHMYDSQDSVTATIQKLNLFQQTSWVFCNGRVNEGSESDKPLTQSEWLKKRSGEMSNLVSFLFKPDLLSKDRLLVIFILHSAVTDISSPILEAFCAIYRTLEGVKNMLCICKDSTVFSHWRQLIDCRCKEDITSKCIYELSLNEISSTIKKLKEPQTQSSRRFLPSTGSSSVLLMKKDEELMTVLDILCENECENTEIEMNDSFQNFKIRTEEDFYRGGQVTWWNFYLSEKDSLPFISRDKYKELYDLITPVEGHITPCVIINLFHHPGCGGTTLAMHVLWNLRGKFRCAVVKNNMAANHEIAAQVINLLTYGKQEQSSCTPVLLLVDNWDDVEDLKQCILTAANDRRRSNQLLVIILSCERTRFPDESSRNSRSPNVFITNKLSQREQALFSDKLQQLKSYHEKPDTFYAFMIMTNNFSDTYISNLVNNIVGDLDATTQEGRLFSFLALLNTYVNGSYMSLSLCEELVGIRNVFWKQDTLVDRMNPYSTLMITFTVEEHGSYQAVRLLHQMIARKCLEVLTQRHNLSRTEMIVNLLHCDKLYKSCMGKDFLVHNIQSMLVTRHRKDQGDDKDTLFSPVIEDIEENEGSDRVEDVLEKATCRFDKSATLPQALARYFCLRKKDFKSALKWALVAQSKNANSYIADTVGQVYKINLKKEIENPKALTPESLDQSLKLASCAVNAFQESQELAKKDDFLEAFDMHHRKRPKSYNVSGYAGEMDVIMILLDVIKELPVFTSSDRHKRDKVLQFLKGHHSVSSLFDSSSTTINQDSDRFIAVLADHERFLISLKPRLSEVFKFFESYFTYLKPRSPEKATDDEKNKRKISEHFKKYMQIFSISEEEKASEKKSKPNLSLSQEIVDHKLYLETKRADSFAGLLQHLNDKNPVEMEHILKKWQFIFERSPSRKVSDTVNFILANVVLHSLKPSSTSLKKYEELVSLLNDALQSEGTHSRLTEVYYLSMLLMWPSKDQRLESLETYKNISVYVASIKKSFHRRFSHMFPARSAIAHFFLGKSNELKRVVPKVKLDQILVNVSRQQTSSSGQPRNLHQLWQSGEAWNEPEIQKKLLRIKGQSEQGDIYVNYGGTHKMQVRPVYLGDIRSGYSREEVSFYLGFTLEGPVAYNIKYENEK